MPISKRRFVSTDSECASHAVLHAPMSVLVDAVVRNDGTAGLIVREYVRARYRELLDDDRLSDVRLPNLLEDAEEGKGEFAGHRIIHLGKQLQRSDRVMLAPLGHRAGS
jgi:hypothetical protein